MLHHRERGDHIPRDGISQAGVNAGGGVKIGVDGGHHCGHRAPSGKSGHIHPGVVDRIAVHHLAGDPSDVFARAADTGALKVVLTRTA